MCRYEDTLYFQCNHEIDNTRRTWQCESAIACEHMDRTIRVGDRSTIDHDSYYDEKSACMARNGRSGLIVLMDMCDACKAYPMPLVDPFTRIHMGVREVRDVERPATPPDQVKMLAPMIPEVARHIFKLRETEVPRFQEHDARAMLAAAYFFASHLAGRNCTLEELLKRVQSSHPRFPVQMREIHVAYSWLFEARDRIVPNKYLGSRMGNFARLPIPRPDRSLDHP